MIVVVDIDDVVVPWAQTVHDACVTAGINRTGRLWEQWAMWESYDCTREEWLEVVNGLVAPDGLYHQPPYPGAAEALRRLYWKGHDVHLVTSRGFMDHAEQIRQWTVDFKEEFALPGVLHFAQDKGRVAREVGATHGIDDRLKYVEDLLEVGVDAYLMSQPHNEKYAYVDGRRVDSLTEFVDKILEEEA